jgi:hypothetical protein
VGRFSPALLQFIYAKRSFLKGLQTAEELHLLTIASSTLPSKF